MSGGVPGWTWRELGPMVRDLDAIYLNFISGFELASAPRRRYGRAFVARSTPTCTVSFSACSRTGCGCSNRSSMPPPGSVVSTWFSSTRTRCASSPRPALPIRAGARRRRRPARRDPGRREAAAYVAAPGFDRLDGQSGAESPDSSAVRTALIAGAAGRAVDPTGCGDVFGAAAFARLLAGDTVEAALRHANAMAGRNAMLRGAGGLGAPSAWRAPRPVTRVIEIPAHLDDRSFEQFAAGFGAWPPDEKLLFDARGAQWSSPYGLIGMLTAGQAVAEARARAPALRRTRERRCQVATGRASGSSGTPASSSSSTEKCPRSAATGPRMCCSTSRRCAQWKTYTRRSIGSPRPPRGFCRRARARADGDRPVQYGAFGGMSEYCGARRHRWMGRGTNVYLSAPPRPTGSGHRRERRRYRVPPIVGEHPRQALRRALGRRRGARGRADPERQPLPRPRPGSGVSGRSSGSWTSGRARSRSGAVPPGSRSCRCGTRTFR